MADVIVRAANRTYGLRPAQEPGEPEHAVSFNSWNGAVETAEGNYYSNGNYLIVSGDVHSLRDSRYDEEGK